MGRTTKMVWRNATNQVLRSRAYGYSLAGIITNAVYESSEKVDYTYDSLDRLTGEKYTDVHGEVISEDRYEYDLAGNRTKKAVLDGATNTLTTVNYALSTVNRLGSWSVAEAAVVGRVTLEGHASEPVGTNDLFGYLWVSNAIGGAVKPQVAGTNFWAHDLTVGQGPQTVVAAIRDMAGNMGYASNTVLVTVVTNGAYQYSAAGCVTNVTYTGPGYTRTLGLNWNGQYQLTAVRNNGSTAESFGYDALGRRAWTAAGGVTNWSVYDGPHVIADLDATGAVLRTYVWGPGIDNLLVLTTYGAATNTYYPLKDHLNSTLALTDSSGQIVEQYRYDAWGRTTVFDGNGNPLTTSAVGNRYCWQGREYSWKTRLYYFRARWYDPIAGRWLSNDPIGISGGLNQYVAFGNNPVNNIDPFGLDALDWSANFFAGFADSMTLGLSSVARTAGGYDYVDRSSGLYAGGGWSGVAMTMAIGGAGAAKATGGLKSIPYYELGQKWLPGLTRRAGRLGKWNLHDPVTKGRIILRAAKGNWLKAFWPETVFKPFSWNALRTGPTPLGKAGTYAAAQILRLLSLTGEDDHDSEGDVTGYSRSEACE